ncbi:MAG: subclass B1 metallo-beta-lactamase [Chitinophagales bacterium]|nr:subclass B1 metallo-beta-lactamase [Chitinophagales bacterium]
MKFPGNLLLLLSIAISVFNCSTQKQGTGHFKAKKMLNSEALIITQVSENSFIHTTYLQTNDFGKVPCNGLIVRNSGEAIVFDTPSNDKDSEALMQWIKTTLNCKIVGIIPTHFHHDCLGGLKAFEQNNIPSYANVQTLELAKANNYTAPQNGFRDSLVLRVGVEKVTVKYFGEGHTKDNVVGYFPGENVMFGGCLVKTMNASKGYLGDANVAAWSETVEKVKRAYPDVKVVVPGHGDHGGKQLLDYTIQLFKQADQQ